MQSVPETLYHDIQEIDEGRIPFPRAAYFTPTYVCNQKCFYCFYKEWNNKGEIEPADNIPKIYDQLKSINVKSIEFEGGGDPLMVKDTVGMFRMAAERGFRLGLLTNGMKFCGDVAETFLKLGTYVRISLDTTDREKYKRIRGTDDLPTVLNNIREAIAMKKQLKSRCDISVKLGVSTEVDAEDIFKSYHVLESLGLDNIQVKNLWDKSGQHFRNDVNRSELLNLRDKNLPMVKKVVYPKYMDEPCFITPVQIAVDIRGDFYLCVYYMHNPDEMRVGNMFKVPLNELWGSDEHKSKINSLKISNCLKHDCRFQKHMRVVRKLQNSGYWEFL